MPRLDGTGPNNKGAKTGRGLGTCNIKQKDVQTNNEQQNKRTFFDCGLGLRLRNSRGLRNRDK